jgi:hypothetical protein
VNKVPVPTTALERKIAKGNLLCSEVTQASLAKSVVVEDWRTMRVVPGLTDGLPGQLCQDPLLPRHQVHNIAAAGLHQQVRIQNFGGRKQAASIQILLPIVCV